MMAVGDKEQEIFLGREFARRREISERTAQMVDGEVKRLLDEAYERASVILSEQSRAARSHRAGAARARDHRPRGPATCWSRQAAAAARARRAGTARDPSPTRSRLGSRPRADPRSASGRTRRRVNVTPLALHSTRAVRDALRSHGWEEALGGTAAEGTAPSHFI